MLETGRLQTTIQYRACALRDGYLGLQLQTENI